MSRGLTSSRARALAAAAGSAVVATVAAGCGSQHVQTDADNLVRGKQQFVAKCGSCHVLDRAGTKGNVGPNLDAAFAQSLSEGFGRSSVRGVVEYQIRHPAIGQQMPANLVKGDVVGDVAAYVASVTGKKGADEGLLATAVQKAGGGKPAVEKAGKLQIDSAPEGQLAFTSDKATATAGKATFVMANKGGIPHNIALRDAGGKVVGQGKIVTSGDSTFDATLKPGKYVFFCEVQGHEQAGMKGNLTVR